MPDAPRKYYLINAAQLEAARKQWPQVTDKTWVLVLKRADSRVGIDDEDVLAVVGRRPDIRIPSDVEVTRAVNEGTPIVIAKPDSAGAKAFRALADEFLRREGAPVSADAAEPKRGTTKQLHPAGSLNSDGNNNKAPEEALGGPRKRLRLTSRRR